MNMGTTLQRQLGGSMRTVTRTRSVVRGLGMHAPPQRVPNAFFEGRVDTTDEWIRTRTGISARRFASPASTTSALAAHAAASALDAAGVPAGDVEMIVLATTTPDMIFPATANFVQRQIGAVNAFAYDVSATCSGFVFALGCADAQIRSGMVRNALVVGADVYSSIVDMDDRCTCVLFGDGAGAVFLEGERDGDGAADAPGIVDTILHSDPAHLDILYCPGGGTAGRDDLGTAPPGKITMKGRRVFKLAVQACVSVIEEILSKNGFSLDDVDLIVPHQANVRIVEAISSSLGVPMDKFVVTVEEYGNTSAASIPMALAEAAADGRLQPGMLVLLVGVGAGFSWGASLVRM